MVLSDVSAPCSLAERLHAFVPTLAGVLAEDKASGVIMITEYVIMRCGGIADMQGGAALVIGAEAEGKEYDGYELEEDMVLVLCESASSIYVLRAVRVSVWLKVVKSLTLSPVAVQDAIARAGRVASRISMLGHVPPSPPLGALEGMEGAMAAYVAQQLASMQADGTLHGPVSQGGFAVPKAQFRTSGFLTNGGGLSMRDYRRLVLKVSKAETAAESAESRQSHLSRSVSRAESDVESLQSELSGKQAAAARRAQMETTHSLRGVDGQSILFSSDLVSERLRQATADQAALGLEALELGEAGAGQAPEPEQNPEASERGSEMPLGVTQSQPRGPVPLLPEEPAAAMLWEQQAEAICTRR